MSKFNDYFLIQSEILQKVEELKTQATELRTIGQLNAALELINKAQGMMEALDIMRPHFVTGTSHIMPLARPRTAEQQDKDFQRMEREYHNRLSED